MGERSAYRTAVVNKREGTMYSPYLRKQWFVGDNEEDIKQLVRGVAKGLTYTPHKNEHAEVNSGHISLRHDLTSSPGRMFHALVHSIGNLPFDEITKELPPDITNHGIYTIKAEHWDKWVVEQTPVIWVESGDIDQEVLEDETITLAEIKFKRGETVEEGMDFVWKEVN